MKADYEMVNGKTRRVRGSITTRVFTSLLAAFLVALAFWAVVSMIAASLDPLLKIFGVAQCVASR